MQNRKSLILLVNEKYTTHKIKLAKNFTSKNQGKINSENHWANRVFLLWRISVAAADKLRQAGLIYYFNPQCYCVTLPSVSSLWMQN